jgi:hypothetical protein
MFSRETIESYRRMTPSQRLKLTVEATRAAMPYLVRGTPETVARRFTRLRQENDARNRRMLACLFASAEGEHERD